jgi:hypothetical protein
MDKKFLNKIVNQIMRETEMVYPTSDELGYVNFPFSRIYGSHDSLIKKNWTILETLGFFSALPSSPFKQHLEEIYSLNSWGDPYNEQLNYLWDRYVEVFMNKLRKGINIVDVYDSNIPNRRVGQLDESKEINLKDSKFLQKVLKYLIDNTKIGRYEKLPDIHFHYDGYIIVPIGNGFRFDVYNETIQGDGDFIKEWWEEMKEIYSLKNEEVIPLLDEYKDYLWGLVNKISSKEDINESYKKRSWQNDSFIDKVSDDIMRETKKSNEFPHLFIFPFINKPIVVQNIRDISFYVSYFVDHCVQVYGIDWDSEIDSVWYKYIDKFKEKYKIVDSINESKSSNNKFLNKLLDHIKSETKFKKRSKFMHSSDRTIYAGNYVRLPFFPEDWYRGLDDMYITDFIHWIHTTLGINDPTEIEYLWKRYLEWVNKKCNE